MTQLSTTPLLDAFVHELAEHIKLDARFAGVKVRKGWPQDASGDALMLPVIAVLASEQETTKARSPEYAEIDHGDGTFTQLFERESVDMAIVVELWAKSKGAREPLEVALRNLLSGGLITDLGTKEPDPLGLALMLSRYWDVGVRVRLEDSRRWDDRTARLGYVRTTFEGMARAPRIEAVTYNRANVDISDVDVSKHTEI